MTAKPERAMSTRHGLCWRIYVSAVGAGLCECICYLYCYQSPSLPVYSRPEQRERVLGVEYSIPDLCPYSCMHYREGPSNIVERSSRVCILVAPSAESCAMLAVTNIWVHETDRSINCRVIPSNHNPSFKPLNIL